MKAKRISVLIGPIGVILMSLSVAALSVGEMRIGSFLGEPLEVSIGLNSIEPSEESTLKVSLASQSLFEKANIPYPGYADKLEISVDPIKNGRTLIHVKSLDDIKDPFVYLLLKISWAGGDLLREFTALIDPSDYAVKALAQATSNATKLGPLVPAKNKAPVESAAAIMTEPDSVTYEGYDSVVKSGDSLSSITKLFRPDDVTIQQAWIAFYKLNPSAFIGENLNVLVKDSPINFPTHTQMTAIPHREALLEVMRMIEPASLPEGYSTPESTSTSDSTSASSPMPASVPMQAKVEQAPVTTPTLVIGGAPEEGVSSPQPEPVTPVNQNKNQALAESTSQIEETAMIEAANQDGEQGGDQAENQMEKQLDEPADSVSQGDAQSPIAQIAQDVEEVVVESDSQTPALADHALPGAEPDQPNENQVFIEPAISSANPNMGAFEQRMQQQLSANTSETNLIKDELVTTRGENRALLERMARLETQLGKMSQLLEMQTQALEVFNANAIQGNQNAALLSAQNNVMNGGLAGANASSDANTQSADKGESAVAPPVNNDPALSSDSPLEMQTAPEQSDANSASPASDKKTAQTSTETEPASDGTPKTVDILEQVKAKVMSVLLAITEALGGTAADVWKVVSGFLVAIAGLFLISRRRSSAEHVQGISQSELTTDFFAVEKDSSEESTQPLPIRPSNTQDETISRLDGSSSLDAPDKITRETTPEETELALVEEALQADIEDSSETVQRKAAPTQAERPQKPSAPLVSSGETLATIDEEIDALEDSAEEVDRYDAETSLELGKAYVELGEDEIARDFLSDAIKAGNATVIEEAEKLLAELSK